MACPVKNSPGVSARNPKRSRERILAAALKEFAAKGFAGARVDFIARRAAINKRMLYHYFGNKEHLFREVLRLKMAERQAWADTLSGDNWFEVNPDRDGADVQYFLGHEHVSGGWEVHTED